jgi:transcription initiation factor TFIIE subunit alpha
MATKEEQETLRLLVQHVSRAFYEPKYTIVMDMLARHPV